MITEPVECCIMTERGISNWQISEKKLNIRDRYQEINFVKDMHTKNCFKLELRYCYPEMETHR
jgi:hypothetical protein